MRCEVNEIHAHERDLSKFHVVRVKGDTSMFICLVKPFKGPKHVTGDMDQLLLVDTPDLDIFQQSYPIDGS